MPDPTPVPTPAPVPVISLFDKFKDIAIIGAVAFLIYTHFYGGTQPTPIKPPVVTAIKDWRDGMGKQFATAAFRVQQNVIKTAPDLAKFVNDAGTPAAKAMHDATAINCDPSGTIINVQGESDLLNQVAKELGAKPITPQ